MLLMHDHATARHSGHDKTIRKAKKLRQWQGMNKWIMEYVKGCTTCQQNKIMTHRMKMPLYQITMKEGTLPFKQVAMDLIMGLPKHNGKDAILTIIDHRCLQAAVFLPCTTTIIGPRVAQLYMDHIYKWFGLLDKVISNCDP
jgi:hypothetical protein